MVKRLNKKGQMKIQQMAFMLLAVTLFFALVGMFFLMIFFSDIENSAESIEERNSLLLVSSIVNSPEFACGSAFGSTKLNCIDFDKLMALQSNSNRYSNFWKVDGIEVRKIFPSDSGVCTFSNYPNCGKIIIVDNEGSGVGISNFAALCRNEDRGEGRSVGERCELARIIVYHGGEE
ncbi:MAG: hypothetical protein WDZ62_01805 [Candidatus Pacearchaeota archaeon]